MKKIIKLVKGLLIAVIVIFVCAVIGTEVYLYLNSRYLAERDLLNDCCIIAEIDSTIQPLRFGIFNTKTRVFRNIEKDDNIDDEMYMSTFTVDTELYERMLKGGITEEECAKIKEWIENDAAIEEIEDP